MGFFSIFMALLLEQLYSAEYRRRFWNGFIRSANKIARNYDAGEANHGVLAWSIVVLLPAILVAVIYFLLLESHFLLALAWNVLVVYFTLGFRQFSHYFTDIHAVLERNDLVAAREILHTWTGIDSSELSAQEIVHIALEKGVVATHRHVFGVFFWLLLPLGPAGVVLYRLSHYTAQSWSSTEDARSPAFSQLAQRVFALMDWVPLRLSALGFAIVGNFEDAIDAWRQVYKQPTYTGEDILCATAGGALGIRLGGPIRLLDDNTRGLSEVNVLSPTRTLQVAIGLVWRAVILWMGMLALLSIVSYLG